MGLLPFLSEEPLKSSPLTEMFSTLEWVCWWANRRNGKVYGSALVLRGARGVGRCAICRNAWGRLCSVRESASPAMWALFRTLTTRLPWVLACSCSCVAYSLPGCDVVQCKMAGVRCGGGLVGNKMPGGASCQCPGQVLFDPSHHGVKKRVRGGGCRTPLDVVHRSR